MKSRVVKRSVVIAGRKTSVSLEKDFWRALKEIAQANRLTLSAQVEAIHATRTEGDLSSAIRFFVLDRYRSD